jgi:rare lipoprotein A
VFETIGYQRKAGAAAVLIIGALLVTAGCSRSGSGPVGDSRINPKTGTSASERLYAEGDRIPKGGGTYKIGAPYKIGTRWYTPTEDPNYDRVGLGSWYGADFHGRKTANGEIFDMNALTAAHPTLPIPSFAYVTNLSNNRTILVRINDRGPYANDRVIDLSRRSAKELGFESNGVTQVRVKYAGRAPLDGNDAHEQRFLAGQSGPALANRTPAPAYERQAEQVYRPASQSPVSSLPSGLTWRR